MESKQNKKKTFQTKRFHANIGKSNEEIRSRLRGADVGQPRRGHRECRCWPLFWRIAITELDSTGKLDENPANQLPCKRVMAT